MIYFVQAGSALGPIKIGYTADLKGRLSQLQTSTPETLTVLAQMPGTIEDEARLHEQFAHCHLRGEWFEPIDDLYSYIGDVIVASEAEPPAPKEETGIRSADYLARQAELGASLRVILKGAFGDGPKGVRNLATAAGCNPTTAKNWLTGKNFPSGLQLVRLLAASDLVCGWLLYETCGRSAEVVGARCDLIEAKQAAIQAQKKWDVASGKANG